MILVDSNVVVAAISSTHSSHPESVAFFNADGLPRLLLAAHSHAEAYVTLTKHSGPSPIALDPAVAREALIGMLGITQLVGLTPTETVEAIHRFSTIGVGARLYDYLIGRTGLLHGAEAIVTFNIKHMRGLFPDTPVLTPAEWLAR